MSGIEIVVLIGAGVYVTKKVREHRAAKKQQRALLEHGVAQETTPEIRVTSPTSNSHQRQAPAEEEPLPLYMAQKEQEAASEQPENTNLHLPTYDEVRETKERYGDDDPFTDAASEGEASGTHTSQSGASSSSSPATESKRQSFKNKLFKHHHNKAQPVAAA